VQSRTGIGGWGRRSIEAVTVEAAGRGGWAVQTQSGVAAGRGQRPRRSDTGSRQVAGAGVGWGAGKVDI
jgi:hypothetical protein